jgi:hypothetical protein
MFSLLTNCSHFKRVCKIRNFPFQLIVDVFGLNRPVYPCELVLQLCMLFSFLHLLRLSHRLIEELTLSLLSQVFWVVSHGLLHLDHPFYLINVMHQRASIHQRIRVCNLSLSHRHIVHQLRVERLARILEVLFTVFRNFLYCVWDLWSLWSGHPWQQSVRINTFLGSSLEIMD